MTISQLLIFLNNPSGLRVLWDTGKHLHMLHDAQISAQPVSNLNTKLNDWEGFHMSIVWCVVCVHA